VVHIKCFKLLLKKNCFVKEKWKKESFASSGCFKSQKGNGINNIAKNEGKLFFMP
jgi:hypothetical protein